VAGGDEGAVGQLLLLFEPDRLFRIPGLILGARSVSGDDDRGYYEPLAGYRFFLDDDRQFAASVLGYFTRASGKAQGASYAATRGGGEAGLDFRVFPEDKEIELHLWAVASLTGLSARGSYCVIDNTVQPVDCDQHQNSHLISAQASGVYPAGAFGGAFDIARHIGIVFHGVRLALAFGGGSMPTVHGTEQGSARGYSSFGASLSAAFGAARP
jgi:hypothetical protein